MIETALTVISKSTSTRSQKALTKSIFKSVLAASVTTTLTFSALAPALIGAILTAITVYAISGTFVARFAKHAKAINKIVESI